MADGSFENLINREVSNISLLVELSEDNVMSEQFYVSKIKKLMNISFNDQDSSTMSHSHRMLCQCLKELNNSDMDTFKNLLEEYLPVLVSFHSILFCCIYVSDTPLIYSFIAISCFRMYQVRLSSSNNTNFNVWHYISLTAEDFKGYS